MMFSGGRLTEINSTSGKQALSGSGMALVIMIVVEFAIGTCGLRAAVASPSAASATATQSLTSTAFKCTFRRIIAHGDGLNAPIEVELDYFAPGDQPISVVGVGPVPLAGNLHFITRSGTVVFSNPVTGEVRAFYWLELQLASARAELLTLGASSAGRLRRAELLHLLGDDANAIPDLAILSSAGSFSSSTKAYASLQLGQAFAAEGDANAAIRQYDRVAAHASGSVRAEALVRKSSVQIANGDAKGATSTLASLPKLSSKAANPFVVRGGANAIFVSAQHAQANDFLPTSPLMTAEWSAGEDAADSDFIELPGTRVWKTVANYESNVERLWLSIFKDVPNDFPCHDDVECTTTPYFTLQAPINGRFARVAFRITHWYPDSSNAKHRYKIEVSEQERIVGSDTWGPTIDAGVKANILLLINDLTARLRALSLR